MSVETKKIDYVQVESSINTIVNTAKDINEHLNAFAAAINSVTTANQGSSNTALDASFGETKTTFAPLVAKIEQEGEALNKQLEIFRTAEQETANKASDLA